MILQDNSSMDAVNVKPLATLAILKTPSSVSTKTRRAFSDVIPLVGSLR